MENHKLLRSLTFQFKCFICNNIPIDCSFKTCKECENILCTSCYDKMVSSDTKLCPNPNCSKELKYQKPSILAMKIYQHLSMPCKFKEKGCDYEIPLSEVTAHQSTCHYGAKDCEKCGVTLKLIEVSAHNCIVYLKGLLSDKDKEISKMKQQLVDEKCVVAASPGKTATGFDGKVKTVDGWHEIQTKNKLGNTVILSYNTHYSHYQKSYRYYCGKKIGKNNYHLPCNCCNGHCGPYAGNQCQECYELGGLPVTADDEIEPQIEEFEL